MQASRFLTASRSRHFTISHTRTAISASEINFSDNSNLPPPSTRFARVVPASPSYFTGKPGFTDDLLNLEALLRKHEILPTIPGAQAPRIAWKTLSQYRVTVGEPVKASKYHKIVEVLRRLNRIHPGLMPPEVPTAMERYKRAINPYDNVRRPQEVDEFGRGFGVGRRKASTARAYLVEGEGEVLVNGKPLHQAFGRIHDRESAIWALKATGRIDKYNVWAVVEGGGTTGQAESITLAVARALMVHEPALKPALRRGKLSVAFFWDAANDSIKAGCVTRDPRRVERKKPGKLKARKMPAWVKR
ncbi:MAG: 37S ribosomal protein S9, mitochondrial [Icmadophila ericetorum]|nr:37S ribosomal protein S9, mitochondrial [Icmadophila ericetorum]